MIVPMNKGKGERTVTIIEVLVLSVVGKIYVVIRDLSK